MKAWKRQKDVRQTRRHEEEGYSTRDFAGVEVEKQGLASEGNLGFRIKNVEFIIQHCFHGGVKVSTGVISKGCMPRSGWLVKQSGTFLNADNYNYAVAA